MHSEDKKNISDLQTWRLKLLSKLMRIVLLTTVVVGIPNLVVVYMSGHRHLLAAHAFAFLWVIFHSFRTNLDSQNVSKSLLSGLYVSAIAMLFSESWMALIYMVVVPIGAALLLSTKYALYGLALNTLTLFILGTALSIDAGAYSIANAPVLTWLLVSLTYFSVCGALVFSSIFLLEGLESVLRRQRADAEHLQHLSMHDSLTGLANRRMLNARVEHAIAHAQQKSLRFAVILMDVDHFKNVNDAHGHHIGDELIKAVALRLQNMIHPSHMAARLGGDEFVVLVDAGSDAELVALVTHIFAGVGGGYKCVQKQLFVTISLGVAVYPRDGDSADELLKSADVAMYEAKEIGRNRFEFFQPEMNTRLIDRMRVEEDLRHALENEEWVLYFQPRINSQSGECAGAEALVRWLHPVRGLLLPGQFISVAEDNGMIVPIGAWVLRTAVERLRTWQLRYPHLRLSINVSAREFRDEALATRIREAKSGLPENSLELEITESLIIDNVVGAREMLREVRQSGVTVALDDFGTGLSSLAYLKSLPFDVIKIDKSFVNGVETDRQNHAIVKTIVDLAKNLQLSTVAEGVETPEQADVLRSLGVRELQGYHFAHPMAADAFEAWLAQHSVGTAPAQFQVDQPLQLQS